VTGKGLHRETFRNGGQMRFLFNITANYWLELERDCKAKVKHVRHGIVIKQQVGGDTPPSL
jgi:hypothetical protein